MVIEHAERFGPRAVAPAPRPGVGRGEAPAPRRCLLLYKAPARRDRESAGMEIDARARRTASSIAEEDLKLRGEGEILGTRQSGSPGFKLADLSVHADLLPIARDAAQKIVTADPDLAGPQGEAVKVLLHLFEREEAIRLIEAG